MQENQKTGIPVFWFSLAALLKAPNCLFLLILLKEFVTLPLHGGTR
jgi:Gpi18-like mannosyltransferase